MYVRMQMRAYESQKRYNYLCSAYAGMSSYDNNNKDNNNDCISRAPFHVKHAQLR